MFNLIMYANDIGGVHNFEDIEAIPYNHWKKDCEWVVLLILPKQAMFIPVKARTAKDACEQAVLKYREAEYYGYEGDDDD